MVSLVQPMGEDISVFAIGYCGGGRDAFTPVEFRRPWAFGSRTKESADTPFVGFLAGATKVNHGGGNQSNQMTDPRSTREGEEPCSG